MSSDNKTDKGKQHPIVRSKQSRRKMLKSMAAGGGAVVAGKSLPEQWTYPVVDSVLLPVHASTTGTDSDPGVTVCTLSGGVEATQNGYDGSGALNGYYPLGSDTSDDLVSAIGNMTIDPQFAVNPGVTDNFTLQADVSAEVVNGADLSQNVAPLPDGNLPYNSIEVESADFNIVITVTPDNTDFCGQAQSLDIQFNYD